MTESLFKTSRTRFAAVFAAAGFLFAAPMFASGALAQTQLPPPSYGTADTRQDRIEALEAQLREATAENERMQYELNQAQREITRLRGMVGELAGANQALSEGDAEDPAAPAPSGSAGATTPNATPAPPTQQRGASNGTSAAQANATGTLGTIPASPADAGAAYSRARELLVNGRYAEAEVAFRDFLTQYPQAETAADARYWLGFTLLARNDFQNAASTFVEYLQRTPQGPRAPEAQVRLGMALVGMDQKPQGCSAFAALTRRYPNASRAVRDLAAREARTAQCAA